MRSTRKRPRQLMTEQRASNERPALQRTRTFSGLYMARNLSAWADQRAGTSAKITMRCEERTMAHFFTIATKFPRYWPTLGWRVSRQSWREIPAWPDRDAGPAPRR